MAPEMKVKGSGSLALDLSVMEPGRAGQVPGSAGLGAGMTVGAGGGAVGTGTTVGTGSGVGSGEGTGSAFPGIHWEYHSF